MVPQKLYQVGRVTALGCLLLMLATSGCSFNRAWKRAAATPVPVDDITGRWDGVWLSETNKHTGRLRCLMTKDETGQYQARFKAVYQSVLTFTYTVPLRVVRVESGFQLHGEENLGGYAGGVYTYDGQATPANFFATYQSKYDYGTFRLTRPADAR